MFNGDDLISMRRFVNHDDACYYYNSMTGSGYTCYYSKISSSFLKIRLFSDPDDRVDIYEWNIYYYHHNFSSLIQRKNYRIFFDRKMPNRNGVYNGRYERHRVKIGIKRGFAIIAFPEHLDWIDRIMGDM